MEQENTETEPVVEVVRSEDDEPVVTVEVRHFRDMLQDDPEIANEVRAYFSQLLVDYTVRMAEIEVFLGFVESAEALGTRLERVERFVGIKVPG
jgi:hypothetical protein